MNTRLIVCWSIVAKQTFLVLAPEAGLQYLAPKFKAGASFMSCWLQRGASMDKIMFVQHISEIESGKFGGRKKKTAPQSHCSNPQILL